MIFSLSSIIAGRGLVPQDIVCVCVCVFLQLIPAALVRQYKRAMLNIHPALLPNFGGKGLYGGRVHSAVIASGARFSGPTIHFVDEGCVPQQAWTAVLSIGTMLLFMILCLMLLNLVTICLLSTHGIQMHEAYA